MYFVSGTTGGSVGSGGSVTTGGSVGSGESVTAGGSVGSGSFSIEAVLTISEHLVHFFTF